jgi:hypothetical protein
MQMDASKERSVGKEIGWRPALLLDDLMALISVAITGLLILGLTGVFLWRKRTAPLKSNPS